MTFFAVGAAFDFESFLGDVILEEAGWAAAAGASTFLGWGLGTGAAIDGAGATGAAFLTSTFTAALAGAWDGAVAFFEEATAAFDGATGAFSIFALTTGAGAGVGFGAIFTLAISIFLA